MTYKELMDKHQAEIDNFPFVFAFSDEQFYKGIAEKWGYTPEDTDKILSIGAGGFIRKEDKDKYNEMGNRHFDELQEALKDPDFAEGAIYTELVNHEYCLTHDPEEALLALGIFPDEVADDPQLLKAFKAAEKRALQDCE